MGAKYCKNVRCSEAKGGKPCAVADECPMFLWDVGREKGNKPAVGSAVPKEDEEQREFAAWCDAKGLLWAHIPNERKASALVLWELEKQGLKKGFPDNFIAEPRGKYHGLFIELKRAKKCLSKKSPEQREWVKKLKEKGYKAVFCHGAEEAKRVALDYLEDKNNGKIHNQERGR